MYALVLTVSLFGTDAALPGIDRFVDRLDARGERMEQALDRHSGAIAEAARNLVTGLVELGRDIFWGAVILAGMWLVGKVLDIVKVIVTAKYST